MKEMTGSGIFVANEEDDELESGSANPSQNKTGIRMYQVSIEEDHHLLQFICDCEKNLCLVKAFLTSILDGSINCSKPWLGLVIFHSVKKEVFLLKNQLLYPRLRSSVS